MRAAPLSERLSDLHPLLFDIIDTVRSLGWSGAFELLVGGVVLGSLYALVALGYSLVYGILKLLNFAHGDVMMIGAFMGIGVLSVLDGGTAAALSIVPLLIVMFVVAMLGSGVLGVVIERVAYRPLRNAPRIAPLISALGVVFFLEASVQLLTDSNYYQYTNYPVLNSLSNPVVSPWGQTISVADILVVGMSLALMVLLILLINRTRLGKAMRATAFDREAASMMGIDTDRVIAATFFIGSALAGAAGVMYGLLFSATWFFVGFIYGLKAFTAAVVGGIGSIRGAMFGGLLVGVIETFAGGYAGGQWQDLVVFGILVIFLLVRPTGLFGSPAIQKV
jgi:branched-chain amino acid transport system permease protein